MADYNIYTDEALEDIYKDQSARVHQKAAVLAAKRKDVKDAEWEYNTEANTLLAVIRVRDQRRNGA